MNYNYSQLEVLAEEERNQDYLEDLCHPYIPEEDNDDNEQDIQDVVLPASKSSSFPLYDELIHHYV